MSGDLFEILFVVAFILFGLLGGRKKKPGAGQPQRPRQPPRTRPAPRRFPERSTGSRPPGPETAQDALLRELEGLLTGRRPAPVEAPPEWAPTSADRIPDPEEARSLESLEDEASATWEAGLERAEEVRDPARWTEGMSRGATSLETLEEAGEKSHVRFHERYDTSAPAPAPAPEGPGYDLSDVRRAVVWSEILGPPVSQR
jgi:hypothetical protein